MRRRFAIIKPPKKSHIKILWLAAKRDFVADAENAKRGYKFAACPHAAAKIRDLHKFAACPHAALNMLQIK